MNDKAFEALIDAKIAQFEAKLRREYHLPGQHDQQSHAGDNAGAAKTPLGNLGGSNRLLPANSVAEGGSTEATKLSDVVIHKAPTKVSKSHIYWGNVTVWGRDLPKGGQTGRWIFDSAIGGFGRGADATFEIHGQFGGALQKARQQAAAWGHNQIRLAP